MRLVVVVVVVAAVVGLARAPAFAEPPGMTPPLPPAPQEPVVAPYYGLTLAADGVALVTAMAALGGGDSESRSRLFQIAAGTYVFGGPLIHLVHRRPGRAAISLAMRAGLPIGGALLLSSSHHNSCPSDSTSCDDFGGFFPFLVGFVGGILTASIVDSAVLARGDDPPARSWGPTVAPGRGGGFTFGVGGAF